MKKIFIPLAAGLLLAACTHKGKQSGESTSDADTLAADNTAPGMDSTVYGKSIDEFGMSTFAIVTDEGDTLVMDRGENHLYGNIDHAGDRFAVTYYKHPETGDLVLGEGINLTDLDGLTKDYAIANGRLVLQDDTVAIQDLTPDKLVANGKNKHELTKKH